jgi:hypothetical protein
MEKFMSLYDYLGKPAGSELGKRVATEAVKRNVPIDSRMVYTPKYKGEILLYPEWFLKEYFNHI